MLSAILSCPNRQLSGKQPRKLTFKMPIATMAVLANIAAVRKALCLVQELTFVHAAFAYKMGGNRTGRFGAANRFNHPFVQGHLVCSYAHQSWSFRRQGIAAKSGRSFVLLSTDAETAELTIFRAVPS